MADGSACSSCTGDGSPSSGAVAEHETLVQNKLERRSSKSRLSKQEVVEVTEEMDLPDSSSQGCAGSQSSDATEFRTSEAVGKIVESKKEVEEEEDHSPNSDSSDQTVVPAGLLVINFVEKTQEQVSSLSCSSYGEGRLHHGSLGADAPSKKWGRRKISLENLEISWK